MGTTVSIDPRVPIILCTWLANAGRKWEEPHTAVVKVLWEIAADEACFKSDMSKRFISLSQEMRQLKR